MASGISDKYKLRPNLGPYSGAMVKAVASIAVVALHHIQSGKFLFQFHTPPDLRSVYLQFGFS
jgi:hypothetical protein